MLVQSIFGSSNASGSAGDKTAARNRFGLYLRNRVSPVNPSSNRQQVIRSIVATLAQGWNADLSQAQRDAWKVYGDAITFKNAIGEDINLTGFNHYIRSNSPILQAGGTRVDDAPVILTLPETDPTAIPTISVAASTISVAFDDALPWVDEDEGKMLILMGSPVSGSRNFVAGPYRFAGSIDGNGTTPPTSPQTVVPPFPVAADQKTNIQFRISREDGRLSEPFRSTTIILV